MKTNSSIVAVAVAAASGFLLGSPALAFFHEWELKEVYSNADGTVQFIEFFTTFNSQYRTDGERVVATLGGTTNTFTFPNDLPSDATAGHHLLLATADFAGSPGAVTPDFTLADGFLFRPEGIVNFAGANGLTYVNLPTDGIMSLHCDANNAVICTATSIGVNSPTNYAGESGSIGHCTDTDHDGFGSPAHATCPGGAVEDCDDGNAAVFPGNVETKCNGLDDDCDPGTSDDPDNDCVLSAEPPNNRLKNRYISFKPGNVGKLVKLKVTLTASLPHPGSVDDSWWVKAPVVTVPDLFPKPLVGPGECVAQLGAEASAAEMDWDAAGCQTLHVTGCPIEPTSEYEVQAVFGGVSSLPLTVSTALQPSEGRFWGDTVGTFDGTEWTAAQGVSNINDAVVAINTFQGGQVVAPIPGSTIAHLSVPDVEPGNINTVVNFADVLILINAFKGDPYPFGPADADGNCP